MSGEDLAQDLNVLRSLLTENEHRAATAEAKVGRLYEQLAERDVALDRSVLRVAELEAEVERLKARIDGALTLHREWPCYDECDHEHTEADVAAGRAVDIEDVGLTCSDGIVQRVCRECHTDDGYPREGTEDGEWPCATVKALRGEGEK